MTRVYEVPTHLQVEDALIAGLSPRQLLRLLAGASIAYGIWDQAILLPPAARAAAAALVALCAVVMALFQPGGRPIDQWVFAAVFYALLPHRWIWRPTEFDSGASEMSEASTDWADLAPALGWGRQLAEPDDVDEARGQSWWIEERLA
jgi:PrgI family protein